jgi:hypothetical protein
MAGFAREHAEALVSLIGECSTFQQVTAVRNTEWTTFARRYDNHGFSSAIMLGLVVGDIKECR